MALGARAGAALVIGLGRYASTDIPRLPFSPADADGVADLLVDPEVCGFRPESVVVLKDEEARRDAIVHHIAHWLPRQAAGSDIAVLYFAGHGMVHRIGPRQEAFLMPYDARLDDLVTWGVAMNDVGRWLEAVEARSVVLLVDCCHAGHIVTRRDATAQPSPRDYAVHTSLLQGIAGKGRFVLASCDDGQYSLEAPELGHGLFTHHLLNGIRGAADRDGDGLVGITELFEYVASTVERDSQARFGQLQKPWYSAMGTGGVYISARGSRLVSSPQTRVSPQEARAALVSGVGFGRTESEVLPLLRAIEREQDARQISTVLRYLASESTTIAKAAQAALQAIGWSRAAVAVEELSGAPDPAPVRDALKGLAAIEATLDLVALLDRLADRLKGDLRNTAILLVERKRLGLSLEVTQALFREIRSPYLFRRALGQGLLTAAYLVQDEFGEMQHVVRLLRPEFAQQPRLRGKFMEISQRAMRLVHQNLVLTREVRAFPDRGVYYALRDYVDGVTLRELTVAGRVFSLPQVLDIMRCVLDALTPIHALGLCHGGIKPSNIFVCVGERMLLGDLSFPMDAGTHALDRLSYDFRYVPPEIADGQSMLGPSSDFYALGCVGYELLCGMPPFMSDNYLKLAVMHSAERLIPPRERGTRLPAAAETLLLRLLARSPTARFATLLEARQAVEAAAAALESAEPAIEPPRRTSDATIMNAADRTRIRVERSPVAPNPVEPVSAVQPDWFELVSPAAPDRVQPVAPAASNRVEPVPPVAPDGVEPVSPAAPNPGGQSRWFRWGRAAPKSTPPESVSPKREPQTIGKYRIVERIGRGGMGTVYKAHDTMLDRFVAIKVISRDADVTDELRARFFREAQASARLSHPNVTAVYDMGEDDGSLYIVMEFLEGEDLRQLIAQRRNVPLEAKLSMMIEICDGLDYAHKRGIVHRDIKPGNIYVMRDGHVKLLDFGIARISSADDGLTRSGVVMGTLRYMSPEQARGRVDSRSDIFSMGAVFYELLGYRHAFEGESPLEILDRLRAEDPTPLVEVNPAIPVDLSDVIDRALKKDPGERFSDCGQLRDALAVIRQQAIEESALHVTAESKGEEGRVAENSLTLPLHESAQFTVYRPRIVRPMVWYRLLAFAHVSDRPPDAPPGALDPIAEVRQQVHQTLGIAALEYQDVTQDSRQAVPAEGEVTFVAQIPGFEFNPSVRTFQWKEPVQREEFRLRAGSAVAGTTARGVLTVFHGRIVLAEVALTIRVSHEQGTDAEPDVLAAESARRYRRIFASYSHRDHAIVQEVAGYARAIGDRYMIDVDELRSGEVWSDRLRQLIEEADVFQLFWSRNSMRSPLVRREWEHALSLGRPAFVRPTYWEEPLPTSPADGLPPQELANLHFHRLPRLASPKVSVEDRAMLSGTSRGGRGDSVPERKLEVLKPDPVAPAWSVRGPAPAPPPARAEQGSRRNRRVPHRPASRPVVRRRTWWWLWLFVGLGLPLTLLWLFGWWVP